MFTQDTGSQSSKMTKKVKKMDQKS
jgi:hypothetical protein